MLDPRAGELTEHAHNATPGANALTEATKLMSEVAKNEETRFSNLNTRGVAVISATSLVTALSGIFAKELLGTALTGWGQTLGLYGLVLTLAFLGAATGFSVFGVLRPKHRAAFGDNDVIDNPAALVEAGDVLAIQFSESHAIAESLLLRNTEKAKALEKAYLSFFAAVIVAAVTVGGILVWKLDATGTVPF